jgi:hypothetical protein
MSLTSVFPNAESQHVAAIIIGIISIFSAVLTTINQYIKSQQMMEAHRAASISYGKLNRIINNELALRRDQRINALEFLKLVRTEQDRLENTAPSIIPHVIMRFNTQFADSRIEKPEIAGDLDETNINVSTRNKIVPLRRSVSSIDKTPYETIREPLVNEADAAGFSSLNVKNDS